MPDASTYDGFEEDVGVDSDEDKKYGSANRRVVQG